MTKFLFKQSFFNNTFIISFVALYVENNHKTCHSYISNSFLVSVFFVFVIAILRIIVYNCNNIQIVIKTDVLWYIDHL